MFRTARSRTFRLISQHKCVKLYLYIKFPKDSSHIYIYRWLYSTYTFIWTKSLNARSIGRQTYFLFQVTWCYYTDKFFINFLNFMAKIESKIRDILIKYNLIQCPGSLLNILRDVIQILWVQERREIIPKICHDHFLPRLAISSIRVIRAFEC
jgi:hypothetical protein